MSGAEGQDPARTDPIDLQLPRGATTSGTPQTSTPSITRLIDTKSLLQVTPYHGDKASFLGKKWSFLIAVRAFSKPLYEGLNEVEDNINQDFRKSRLSTGDLELSDQAYTLLALLCKDEACAYVRSAENGNGHRAWQAPLRARTARNATNLLNQLLEPTFTSPDPRINIRQWNKNAEEYATRTSERVSDGMRRAVYMNKIAPQDMRQHLMLNQSRLSTAEEVAQEIEDYWDATEEFSRDNKNQTGFIAPVSKRPVKSGKTNGAPYTFGQGSGTKGKRKMHRRLGFQPERGEQRKFGGCCNLVLANRARRCPESVLTKSTWRAIHLKTRCKETLVNGQTCQRKGKITANPRAKAKEKKRARENVQEKRTTTRTKLDLRMKMDSARWCDFGIKCQRVEFVGDVHESDDFESPFGSSIKSATVFQWNRRNCRFRPRESLMGMKSQRALMKN